MIDKEHLLKIFIDLVKIDSESGNEIKIRKHLEKTLKTMGLETTVDKKGNLIGLLKKTKSNKTVLLSAHMDTVKPGIGIEPIIKNGTISSKGNTILGADDKSGIAIIIEVIRHILENKTETPTLQIVFTVEEEIGILGAKSLKNLKADYGFVLDVSGEIGTVVTRAPSHETFKVSIIGKSAHAGIEPEKGINAIIIASKAISKMNLGRIDFETVSNIGVIKGGSATNIIPDRVDIEGEARSHNEIKLIKQIQHMQNIFISETKKHGAKLQFKSTRDYNTFNMNNHNDIIEICERAGKEIDVKTAIETTGGGSDANYFNAIGIPTVVLSTGMNKVHTVEEEIKISDMIKASEFLLAIIKNIK